MTSTAEIKKAMIRKRKKPTNNAPFLSTGSTLLNLGITGDPDKGFRAGTYNLIVGDSQSGKSIFSLTCFAEAKASPDFSNHRLIFDQPEHGALMDFEHFFGKRVAGAVEIPDPSHTIEEFYDRLDAALEGDRPFIYVLDSMDSLDTKAAKKAKQKGEEGTGSYGTAKAKINSERLRTVPDRLSKTGSILIIISQTRDSLGFGFEDKTRSGGKALRFYASVEIWTNIRKQITKTIRKKPRQIGTLVQIKIRKNRETGKNRVVEIPIYTSMGFSDVDSCVDYLISEEQWKENKGIVKAPEFEFDGKKERLIQMIEEENSIEDLKRIVLEVWNEIESKTVVCRKRRYD